MPLTSPISRQDLPGKTQKRYQRYVQFVEAVNEKGVPDGFAAEVNPRIEELNALSDGDPALRRAIRKTKSSLTNRVIKELKYVPKGYYQTLWMSLGMTAVGLPLGMAFGFALDNFAFLGIGLPLGLPIGLAIGADLDKKAEQKGRQLSVSVD